MPEAPAKRRSGALSLYDDDEEEKPPVKKAAGGSGLYDSGDEAETSAAPVGSASEEKSDTQVTNGEQKKEEPSLEPLQLIAVLGCRRGQRDDMQDAHLLINTFDLELSFVKRCALYAIFDGHAGARAAKYCEEHIPSTLKKKLSSYSDLSTMEKQLKRVFTETFKSVDEGFLNEAKKHCCFVRAVCHARAEPQRLLVVTAPDENSYIYFPFDVEGTYAAAAIVCRKKDDGFSSIELTVDHNPTIYDERMRIQKAGGTVRDGRVNGIIEVSRSIGDGQFKTHGVTCIPDMKKLTITPNDRL
ncbi:protein phosphatase 2C [Ancylostoma ceylanicum]|uniref:Protein phosphatase 2C n=1 Tax=Ancylostoma ceylanicum TaxID=53326 RepID=A0A0D6LLV9_9BILA|nr:protein phosphatase 2C [Ancylostoma ceylanicum]